MSDLSKAPTAEGGTSQPTATPVLEALPGRLSDLLGLPIRRLLPRSQRRLVGPWCFLDSFGPLTFASGKPMDVAPHPHIGLQTVSWLLDGEVVHNDSLGLTGAARPGVLNLMTAGRGIAHAEETPAGNAGRLRGLQLWVALPEAHRGTDPAFAQQGALPVLALEGGGATVLMGQLAGTSLARPRVFADGGRGRAWASPRAAWSSLSPPASSMRSCLSRARPASTVMALFVDTLYYLGSGRRELVLESGLL